jgi:hypothetical protein
MERRGRKIDEGQGNGGEGVKELLLARILY